MRGLDRGCPQSRWVWGYCTLPGERICDDPTYELKTKDWKLNAKFKGNPRNSKKWRSIQSFQILYGLPIDLSGEK